ncbi:hypothetical protein GUITHDRAFT_113341 [Guillardia theta CCMP2712]|uniref:Uncharacterized protein n=1 Tax=Guillardia theta (strain CCMP2712) TaxID=905079 RepID=L1IXH6_GUITC|nr:hypothetical protein GUITHDRAFT_113341 [Guillardia theta CCMP2712]EKX40555.1 hypothetical protein GUITHDRAFT_113341 [Guillardia theta CCMP2712]|eukprot:XP_005827535.1 hypothetical protein GUITHDRAFT_113341 [Guillardia theta CCMP2712]
MQATMTTAMRDKRREWLMKQASSASNFSSLGSVASSDSGSQNGSSRNLRVNISQVNEELGYRDNRIRALTNRLVSSRSMSDMHAIAAIDIDASSQWSQLQEKGLDKREQEDIETVPPALTQSSEVIVSNALARRGSMNDLSTASYKRINLKSESSEQSSTKTRRKSEINRYLIKTYARLGQPKESEESRPIHYFVPELEQTSTREPEKFELNIGSGLSNLWDDCKKMSDSYLGGAMKNLQQTFVH